MQLLFYFRENLSRWVPFPHLPPLSFLLRSDHQLWCISLIDLIFKRLILSADLFGITEARDPGSQCQAHSQILNLKTSYPHPDLVTKYHIYNGDDPPNLPSQQVTLYPARRSWDNVLYPHFRQAFSKIFIALFIKVLKGPSYSFPLHNDENIAISEISLASPGFELKHWSEAGPDPEPELTLHPERSRAILKFKNFSVIYGPPVYSLTYVYKDIYSYHKHTDTNNLMELVGT